MGPLNHWFFLAAVGSGDHGYGNSPTCNNSTVTGIGNDKAAKIWYKALASYANSSENYHQARIDSLKAAADLYGTHCTEYNTIDAAWAAVSVTGADPVPGSCNSQPGSPSVTNPGNQSGAVGTAVSLQITGERPWRQDPDLQRDRAARRAFRSTPRPASSPVLRRPRAPRRSPSRRRTPTTPPVRPSFTWTITGGGNPPGGCGNLPAWSSAASYVPGDQVSYNGHKWSSQWYSTGAEPGAPGSWAVWKDAGAC